MRYYRAPELLLSSTNYSTKIDVWSAGCMLAELFNRKVLFAARQPDLQLSLILSYLGKPKPEQMDFIKDQKIKEAILNMDNSY